MTWLTNPYRFAVPGGGGLVSYSTFGQRTSDATNAIAPDLTSIPAGTYLMIAAAGGNKGTDYGTMSGGGATWTSRSNRSETGWAGRHYTAVISHGGGDITGFSAANTNAGRHALGVVAILASGSPSLVDNSNPNGAVFTGSGNITGNGAGAPDYTDWIADDFLVVSLEHIGTTGFTFDSRLTLLLDAPAAGATDTGLVIAAYKTPGFASEVVDGNLVWVGTRTGGGFALMSNQRWRNI